MIFLLSGEDSFRSKEKLTEIKNAFSKKNPLSGIVIFDFSEKTDLLQDLLESFGSGGLFSNKKMIVFNNLLRSLSAEHQKVVLAKLLSFENIKNDLDLIVVFWENGKPKKNLSLFKYLEKNSKKQEFNLLNFKELEIWVIEYINLKYPKISFSSGALSSLISFVGNDLFLLKNEIEKVSNFKNEGEISENDVNILVNSRINSTIFQAIEALLNNNKKISLLLLHDQIEKGEEPFYILSMYVYQVRSLLKIASSIANGNMDAVNISKETGIHPYVVKKSMSQAKTAGLKKIHKLFKELQKIDFEAKMGKIDIKTALDRLIVKI